MAQKPKSRANGMKGGRPPYQPSVEDRLTVERMKFCGESERTIGLALGVDARTLRKHFAYELEHGHANRRREIVDLLFKSAGDGNVSAQKRLDDMGRVAGAAAAVKEREVRPPKLGKKEEQQIAAENVAGKFAPPEPPKLVVNNN
jgi:hypothetical protein